MSCSDIAEFDFSLYKGDDVTRKFRYLADGLPVDITGYTIVFETNIVELQQEAVISDPLTGEFTFSFAGVDTESLTQSRTKYEVAFYPSGLAGPKTTKFRGSVKLTNQVL